MTAPSLPLPARAAAAQVAQGQSGEGSEKLAIFGTRRARRGAELKVMSAVEHKHPGHFLTQAGELRDPLNQPGDNEGDGWNYDMARTHTHTHTLTHTFSLPAKRSLLLLRYFGVFRGAPR